MNIKHARQRWSIVLRLFYQLSELLKNKREREMRPLSKKLQVISYKRFVLRYPCDL